MDLTSGPWVSVQAKSFFFEPYCTELKFDHPCKLFVTFDPTSDQGVEIDAWDDGSGASVWVPRGGRVSWQATQLRTSVPIFWEPVGDVREFDYEMGEAYDL